MDKVVWKTSEYLRSSEDVRISDFAVNSLFLLTTREGKEMPVCKQSMYSVGTKS